MSRQSDDLEVLRARSEAAVAAARLAESAQPAPHRERLSSNWDIEELSAATRAAVEGTLAATGGTGITGAAGSSSVEISANPKGARVRGKWWQIVVVIGVTAVATAGVIFALHVWS